MIKEYFKEKNIKLTKQRELIFNIIDENEEVTFKDIKEKCNNEMDNSTIYRIIELFLKNNIINKTLNEDIYYSINKNEHKHYIYCVKCHKKDLINICPIDYLNNTGYKVLSHQIQINGICNECQKK
ncbi:MAG: transcriptional repressor [Bacilli bacterium]|nr:transcriptional repressor [Bacilli bacterium]